MPTVRETALDALFTRLQTVSGPEVLRNQNLPEDIPAGGLLNLRDGDPGEPERLFSPEVFIYTHAAVLEVMVQDPDQASRDAAFDAILAAIAAALEADDTLGGAVEWCEASPAEPIDLAIEGAAEIKAAEITIEFEYETTSQLG